MQNYTETPVRLAVPRLPAVGDPKPFAVLRHLVSAGGSPKRNENRSPLLFVSLFVVLGALLTVPATRATAQDAEPEQGRRPAVEVPPPLPPDDGSVWVTIREWTLEEEQRYAEWVRDNVDRDFFRRYDIVTDCADAAYAIRFIYARIRGLPQGCHSKEGGVFGNWRKDYSHISRARDWVHDQRFRTALRFALDFTLGRCLLMDTYPIKLWPDDGFLRPGTVFVNSRHAGFVYDIDRADFFPIKCAYSTMPPKVRSLVLINYEEELTFDDLGYGLVNWRWWKRNPATGEYAVLSPDEMPGYSLEQYENIEDLALQIHKAYSIIQTNPEMALDEGMGSLREALELRAEVVIEGWNAYRGWSDRSTESYSYDNYSTPGRDGRIRGKFRDMDELVRRGVFTQEELIARLSSETFDPKAVPLMNFLEVRHAFLAEAASPEPWDPPAARWGVGDYRLVWHREFDSAVKRLIYDDQSRIVGYTEMGPYVVCSLDGTVSQAPSEMRAEWEKQAEVIRGIRRRRQVSENSPDPVLLADGSELVVHAAGRIECYEPGLDEPRWVRSVDDRLYAGAALGPEDQVYVPTEGGVLLAIHPDTGDLLWKTGLGERCIFAPIADRQSGNIYVAGSGSVFAVSPGGKLRWSQSVTDAIYAPPGVGPDGGVYVGSLDQKLAAFYPDGRRRWVFPARAGILATPLVSPDGRYVFCLEASGRLYCLTHRDIAPDKVEPARVAEKP